MTLQEILNQLASAEFSQLHLGSELDTLTGITTENVHTLVPTLNTGLTDLHTRFLLREGRLTVTLQPGRFTYPLRAQYAEESNSKEVERYIQGSFAEDLLKVEQVITEPGFELSLNEQNNPLSVQTPSMNVLRVPQAIVSKAHDLPDELKTDTLTVIYRANHPLITEDFGLDDPEEDVIELPYSHLQALCYFMASRLHNPTGMSNTFHMGNSYKALYEAECQRLEHFNIQVNQYGLNDRLTRNGWV